MRLVPVIWFNDTDSRVLVYLENLANESFAGTAEPHSEFRTHLKLEEDYTVFIKQWPSGIVMISTFLDSRGLSHD